MQFKEHDIVVFFFILALLILVARLAGEWCKKRKIPAVIGELLAGVIIGPTILGNFFPEVFASIFKASEAANLALSGILSFASVLILFVVGLEIDVRALKAEKKPISWLGGMGIILPLTVGLGMGWILRETAPGHVSPLAYSLLIGSAFAVSALPVIARVLLDMNMLKSRMGMIIIGSAAMNDIVGWLTFVFALSLAAAGETTHLPLWVTALGTLLLVLSAVTVLPKILGALLKGVEKLYGKNTGTIALVILPILFGLSAFTEYLGVHALMGAFILGVALSGVEEFKGFFKESIEVLTLSFFAPVFFVAVGLKANFFQNFDFGLVLIIFATAFFSKVFAALIGGKLGGLSDDESLAAGLGLAARGGMGIILATVAYSAGAIALPMFAALLIMAVTTSLTAMFIPWVLERKKAKATDTISDSTPEMSPEPEAG